jgi:hypothetical protein
MPAIAMAAPDASPREILDLEIAPRTIAKTAQGNEMNGLQKITSEMIPKTMLAIARPEDFGAKEELYPSGACDMGRSPCGWGIDARLGALRS